MPIKGILLIIISAILVAILKRNEIWEWLNDNGDTANTDETKE